MENVNIEKNLKYKFKNKKLLSVALTHSSYINENRGVRTGDNERLEFLGDAVLDIVVGEYLYKTYKDANEGELSRGRSNLVNTQILAEKAKALNINEYLKVSKGQVGDGTSDTTLAGAYEAMTGAIYLDSDYETVRKFIKHSLLKDEKSILKRKTARDSKTEVQEISQLKYGIIPEYKVLSETGPDHERKFIIGLYIKNKCISKGKGFSKKNAEKDAALEAIKKKNW